MLTVSVHYCNTGKTREEKTVEILQS